MANSLSPNPLAETPSGDADDQDLVRHVQQGSRDALELLIAPVSLAARLRRRRTETDRPAGFSIRSEEHLMRTSMSVLLAVVSLSCGRGAETPAAQEGAPDIVAMERAALARWGKGDPQGYLEMMADEVSYFDPMQERRVDGREAMLTLLAPLTGKVKVDRFEMLAPRVQHHGDAALLTFNLVSYTRQADGSERAVARWNSSELYGRVNGQWRIVHSHWSYIKPELRQPVSGTQ